MPLTSKQRCASWVAIAARPVRRSCRSKPTLRPVSPLTLMEAIYSRPNRAAGDPRSAVASGVSHSDSTFDGTISPGSSVRFPMRQIRPSQEREQHVIGAHVIHLRERAVRDVGDHYEFLVGVR